MSCSSLPNIDFHICSENELQKKIELLIEKLSIENPKVSLGIKRLIKGGAKIKTVSFAGRGCYDKNGNYLTDLVNQEKHFKHCVEYYYEWMRDVNFKPIIFVRVFIKIKNKAKCKKQLN